MVEKFNQEKEKNEKLKELKAQLNFEGCSGTSRYTKALSESEDNGDGHWKSRSKKKKSSGEEDDLSQPWVCEETDPFTPRIRHFDFQKTRMPSHIKTYDGSEDLKDHLKIFQAAAKIERWAMPTWCHMFNSTLTENARVWFDVLLPESIDSYDDLKNAFLENYLQQKKYIKDPIEGKVAASNHERKKSFSPWKQHEGNQKQNFKKGGFRKQQRSKRKQDRFSLLTKTPKEIFALDKGKFKAPPPMTTPVEKRNHAKCCEFHGQIQLLVKIGDEEHSASAWMNFMVVRSQSPYNGIIRWPGVRKLQAVPSTAHGMLKILLIADLPMLTAPMEKEELIVYLDAAKETVSAVLMTEREAKQMSVYFVSRALRGPKLNYTSMKKLVLALVDASKRLKRYFQAHPFIVITDQPIQQILSRPKVAGRLQKWSIELREYAIHYRPRVSVKGQILADFIVERPEEDSLDTPIEEEGELPEPWILFTDGSSCTDGSRARLILTNPEGMKFTYALKFRFDATNNEAEYEALIAGLRIAEQMGVKNLQANVDSRLVANQVNETYVAKEADMIRYMEKVKALTGSFRAFSMKQIPRRENKKADALSKIASTSFAHLSKQVLVKELKEKSIGEIEILAVVEEEGDTWMTPLFKYLAKGTLPADVKKAWAIRRKSWLFVHACRHTIRRGLRTGYYWPTMHKDARTLIRACQDCQVHKPVPRNLQQKLTPITSPWPFYKRGIDIAEPFPEGPGKVKFLIVAIDYFTKWIKAKPVVTITGNQIKKFVRDNIVYRFGLPGEIISNNGKQFRDDLFKDWCEKLCILIHFAFVKHPQTNGLVERANRSLKEGIKASNKDTPFSLTYGMEAVIPIEIYKPILRTAKVDLVGNNEALEINLDLLEERIEEAAIREAKSKAKMEKYYNSKVGNSILQQ
nr:protein NYNRIN-like [Tanacetum cinerariifolium]